MSGAPITILIVDDAEEVRRSLREMLAIDDEFLVVGEAGDGVEAVRLARDLRPDVVLMDINLPELDGVAATRAVRKELSSQVIMISVEGDSDYFRRAMQAGACDYLVKPFTTTDLNAAVRNAAARAPAPAAGVRQRSNGKIVTLFGAKGGVGKSTIAANLAVALGKSADTRVALVDFDLEFGALAGMLQVKPRASVVDLCRLPSELDRRKVDAALTYASQYGVWLLAAPPYPHLAAEVEGEGRPQGHRNYVGEILTALETSFDWIIVDTSANFRSSTLTALDRASTILLVTVPEIPALSNTAKCLEILVDQLEYGPDKVRLVLNRRDAHSSLTTTEIAKGLEYEVAFELPADGAAAVMSVNTGQPMTARRSKSMLAERLSHMASVLLSGGRDGAGFASAAPPTAAEASSGKFRLLRRVNALVNMW